MPPETVVLAGLLAGILAGGFTTGCGARSMSVGAHTDAAPPRDAPSPRDLPQKREGRPIHDLPSRPDAPRPPDSGPAPRSWQEIPLHTVGRAAIFDIRGLSDSQVWLVGHGATPGEGGVWTLDGPSFRHVSGPKTPYPLRSVWVHRQGMTHTLWVGGKRTKVSESAIWSRHQGDTSWEAILTPTPTAIDLVAVDGSDNGDVFAIGTTGTRGLAFHGVPGATTLEWTMQLFSDAFQTVEARDLAVAAPGVAYAIGQRVSRVRFWLFREGLWHLDEGTLGDGRSLCVARHGDGSYDVYAGGDRLWTRAGGTWGPLGSPPLGGRMLRLRAASDTLFLLTTSQVWRRDHGGSWKSSPLPGDAKPQALWVSPSWVWVATTTGHLWRHHRHTF